MTVVTTRRLLVSHVPGTPRHTLHNYVYIPSTDVLQSKTSTELLSVILFASYVIVLKQNLCNIIGFRYITSPYESTERDKSDKSNRQI